MVFSPEAVTASPDQQRIEAASQIPSVRELFASTRELQRTNFYQYFLMPELVQTVSARLASHYPAPETFDEVTGEAIREEIGEVEMRAHLREVLVADVLDPAQISIRFLEGIPVVMIPADNLGPELAQAGAFVIGKPLPLGVAVVEAETTTEQTLALQHELVHLVTQTVSLGAVESVSPVYNEFYEVTNVPELNRAELARRFVDEALAYGVNAYGAELELTPEFVARNMFYSEPVEVAGYDVEANAELWADVLNETIRDRSGRKQFRLNNYLIKKVHTLDDLDLTNEVVRTKVENLWTWC